MHCTKTLLVLLGCLSVAFATIEIAITTGTAVTTFSPALVTLGALGVGALAVAKSALFLGALSNRRRSMAAAATTTTSRGHHGHRWGRDVSENTISQSLTGDFEGFFDAIAKTDIADCGKLLICHSVAKTGALTPQEKAIAELFDDVEYINPHSGMAAFQLAAYAGKFKNPQICMARYSRCPVPGEKLAGLIKLDY